MGAFAYFLRIPEHESDSKEVISACKPSDSQTDKSEGLSHWEGLPHWEPQSFPPHEAASALMTSEGLHA